MGNPKKARDADRELAVDFVQAAWADGQLNADELDQRISGVLQARTLDDLQAEVGDLQGAHGRRWHPDPLPEAVRPVERPVSVPPPVPVSVPRDTSVRRAPSKWIEPSRSSRVLHNLAAAAATVAVLALSVHWFMGGQPEPASSFVDEHGEVIVEDRSALSEAGFGQLARDAQSQIGTTDVQALTITPVGVWAVFVSRDDGEATRWDWDASRSRWVGPRPAEQESTAETVDLADVDASVVEAAYVAGVEAFSDVELEGVIVTIAPEGTGAYRSCVRVDVFAAGGDESSFRHTCEGRPVE